MRGVAVVSPEVGAVDGARRDPAWPVLPYLFILLPALYALLQGRVVAAGPAVLAAAWHWFMTGSRFARIRRAEQMERIERPWALVAYFVVLLSLVAVLIRIDAVFSVTALGAFIQSFELLPGRWAYAGVAATAGVLVVARPPDGRGPGEMILSVLIGVLVAATVGVFIRTISRQNAQRKVMIAQLEANAAKLTALAQENADLQARLLGRAREAGVLAERQRMAREIHDTLAQGLTAIITQLEAAESGVQADAARTRLVAARDTAKESLAEARRSVQALRPAALQEAQLGTALRDIAAAWSDRNGVPVFVSVTGEPRPLHAEVEDTVLRVAQEALANVAKHAGAGRAGLTLSYMEDVVALDVRDDGAGFTPGGSGGFGLVAMRQRVTRLAGRFAVESAPGQGTGISATLPALPAESGSGTEDPTRVE
ncbi:sensor histidine kinase [Nonomuraea sp. NPDC050643]|uniref:sensor histidine kinase n=1 Tax=Nonomuraea sp. NPDC050643 TaxID=3155660 RepID=UPI0033C54743